MTKDELRSLLNQPYQFENWKNVVDFVFPNVSYTREPYPIPHDADMVESFNQVGTVRLNDGKNLALFEVHVKPNVNIARNRVALRNLVAKYIDQERNHGVLAIYEKGTEEYRFTFTAKETDYDEEQGNFVQRETETKRFTYVLGKNETCRTARDRFWDLSQHKEEATIKDVENAFSVEKLSKEFFNKYKDHYTAFVNYLTGSTYKISAFKGDEKAIRDFVKKMLGRIVFLHFVQKKGWLGASNADYRDGDKQFMYNLWQSMGKNEAFYQLALAPLFFDALNQNRGTDDSFTFPNEWTTRIPYLGGGLFEKDRDEPSLLTFPVALFDGLFEFFSEYNFTIDENDPHENEVGIDPEMLGHIFENLLEDNKDKGAFYTPKPIVKYMCQESLIQYLHTTFEKEGVVTDETTKTELEEKLNLFVKKYEAGQLVNDYDRILARALYTVKICDPAIGSGAFPMGLLNEMVMLINVLHYASPDVVEPIWKMNDWQAATVKKHIIQNSIYGVDIEKGAVDIARLRFWLSLIIDEEKPTNLPSLDYKIVVGNSLISKFEDEVIDIDWEVKEEATQGNLFGDENEKARMQLLKDISDKQIEFFTAENHQKEKLALEIRNLKIDLLLNQLHLQIKKNGLEVVQSGAKGSLFEKQTEYFLKTKDWKRTLVKLDNLKKQPESRFDHFDWKLDYPEVLNPNVAGKDVGFDIVIGNPPYVGQKGHKEMFQEIKETSMGKKYHQRRMDLFYFFFHVGINNMKSSGILTFITTNYFMTATYSDKLRKHIHDSSSILRLINFNELKIFESAQGQHNLISILKKEKTSEIIAKTLITKKTGIATESGIANILEGHDGDTIYCRQTQKSLFEEGTLYIRIQSLNESLEGKNDHFTVLNKIKKGSETLNKYFNIEQGIVSGADKVSDSIISEYPALELTKGDGIFILTKKELESLNLSDEEMSFIKPVYKNSDLKKWCFIPQKELFLIYLKDEGNPIILGENLTRHFEKFKNILVAKKENCFKNKWLKKIVEPWLLRGNYFVLFYPRNKESFEKVKIVNSRRSYTNTFAIENRGYFEQSDIVFSTLKSSYENKIDIKYFLGILNSKLIYVWLFYRGKRKGMQLELFQKPLSEIPIKLGSKLIQKIIVALVNEILITKGKNLNLDVSNLESQIDLIVYKLYELTYGEVLVVDPDFGMSREEYEAFEVEESSENKNKYSWN